MQTNRWHRSRKLNFHSFTTAINLIKFRRFGPGFVRLTHNHETRLRFFIWENDAQHFQTRYLTIFKSPFTLFNLVWWRKMIHSFASQSDLDNQNSFLRNLRSIRPNIWPNSRRLLHIKNILQQWNMNNSRPTTRNASATTTRLVFFSLFKEGKVGGGGGNHQLNRGNKRKTSTMAVGSTLLYWIALH